MFITKKAILLIIVSEITKAVLKNIVRLVLGIFRISAEYILYKIKSG
jgi:hypothetical protein